MKAWTAALALIALGAVIGCAEKHEKAGPPRAVTSAAPAAPSATGPAPVTPESLPATPSFRQTNTYNGNVVFVPEGCQGPYDLMLHFHGAHPYVRDAVEKAGIAAVVVIYNSGNGAEKYAQAFQAGGMLSSLLRQIDMAVTPLCQGRGAKPRRIALSAWSAGYAAVEKLLTRPEDRERIDAALLADGLHAGFANVLKREFAPNALQAFREMGELAKANEKLFAITHSSIVTDGYASTTECSRLLLRELNVPSEGPLVSGKSGSFSIEGSAGTDAAAHVAQFRQMDATLLSKLRTRWSG
ncbi:MAG TPA: hypothetical protein VJN18_23785 [Polyangiaceae bacterium]|nr:hypothetical protein [Polyangiaceae bacterium]